VGAADDGQGSGLPESISASELGERGDEPMDVDAYPGHVDEGAPQDFESGSVHPDDESEVVESVPVDNALVESAPIA